MRQIVLDTETTGLSPAAGHRIIEIGAIEMINRRVTGGQFHFYLNPDRPIDFGAQKVHGITSEFLADKPRFKEVHREFIDFIRDAELIIHNASFDVGFLNHELKLLNKSVGSVEDYASVLDTLTLARKKHPGQKNSLDALCKRYEIDNFERDLHGALLDSRILAEVYLAMTGGQSALSLESSETSATPTQAQPSSQFTRSAEQSFTVIAANETELSAHQAYIEKIKEANDGKCLFEDA